MPTVSMQGWSIIRLFFTLSITFVLHLYSFAAEKQNRIFEFEKNRIALSGAFSNSYTWQVDLSYHYMINRYLGLGASLGQWKTVYPEGQPKGNDWYVEWDSNDPSNIFFRPSFIFKTPPLRIKRCEIGIFAQPGVMMNIPYVSVSLLQSSADAGYTRKAVSTSKGQWLAFDAKLGLFVNLGPCGFSAGYIISNHDIYGQYRHLSYNNVYFDRFYPEKTLLQGIYAMASYYF